MQQEQCFKHFEISETLYFYTTDAKEKLSQTSGWFQNKKGCTHF